MQEEVQLPLSPELAAGPCPSGAGPGRPLASCGPWGGAWGPVSLGPCSQPLSVTCRAGAPGQGPGSTASAPGRVAGPGWGAGDRHRELSLRDPAHQPCSAHSVRPLPSPSALPGLPLSSLPRVSHCLWVSPTSAPLLTCPPACPPRPSAGGRDCPEAQALLIVSLGPPVWQPGSWGPE